jgi:hypothetical protein
MPVKFIEKSVVLTSTALALFAAYAAEPAGNTIQIPATSAQSDKATRVEIAGDQKMFAPSEYSISYHSKCLDYTYELQIDSLGKKVHFSISSTSSQVYDITSSQFGQTMLNKKFFARIAISCDKTDAHISLIGYDNSSGNPLPSSAGLSIRNDGTIDGDLGFRSVNENYIERKEKYFSF